MATRTDRATLSALLTSGKITKHEESVFQGWYDDLVNGKMIELGKKRRLWADSVYEQHKLGDIRAGVRREARVKAKAETMYLDTMARPLKPPGRT